MPSAAGWPWSILCTERSSRFGRLPAHNIRGLAFAPDGQTLVVAHQVLNRTAQTSFDDVHWGLLDSQPSAGGADRRTR